MKFIIDSKCSLNHRCEQTVNVKQCGGGGGCHLITRRTQVWILQSSFDRSLDALAIFTGISSGCSSFVPPSQAGGRGFRTQSAAALAGGAGLRAGVGPWTWCGDGPQLLK